MSPPSSTEPAPAEGTNRAFHASLRTAASPEAVWRVWMDVPGWKAWDEGLKDARLAEPGAPMKLGTRGTVTPKSGPDSAFAVTAFEEGARYAFETRLPLATLTVERSITSRAPTEFRHDVSFSGPLAFLWSRLFGPGFRRALPPTLRAIGRIAESGRG